ncbi:hypothetical protein IX83_07160 [Basilea psittacipulmonis DSM 24701]|uniref:Uncharacterized protein n=2 Tax=Basilea TaxID=1472344 RepID=A0A077DEF5_9BURK|nr:hypothetical protein IX83_07160 [Basilea psittacipulmonis DSM 24701]
MKTDKEIIQELGGVKKLVEILGLGYGGYQRVNNWRTRGIPAAIKLEHLDVFGPYIKSNKSKQNKGA